MTTATTIYIMSTPSDDDAADNDQIIRDEH